MPFEREIVHRAGEGAYWASQAKLVDTSVVDAGATALGCHRLTLEFSRTTASGTREDRMNCTAHIARHPGAGIYTKIPDSATFAVAEGHLDTWWTAQKALTADFVTLAGYRWHPVDADEFELDDEGRRYDKLGPAERVTARSVAGTATNAGMVDQVAETVTLRTASRKHWGRLYLPGYPTTQFQPASRRFAAGGVDGIATAFRTLVMNLDGSGLELGVWSPRGRAFLTMVELRCDDVPDIQRRRRAKQVAYAKTFSS